MASRRGAGTAALQASRLLTDSCPAEGARPCCLGARRKLSHEVGVAAEVEAPALRGGDAVTGAFPALAVAVEMAVLELHAGALLVLRGEPHLDLAALVGVGFDLPVGRDVPAED